MECITQMPKLPKSPIGLYGPQTYRPSKEKKIRALQAYMEVVDRLLPDDKSIKGSHLWHNDLHAENIFVNPDNPSEICGIIDWQTTELAPLYDHTIEPYFLEYQGPRMTGDLLQQPDIKEIQKLFEDDKELAASEKKRKAESLFWRMALVSLWRNTLHMGIEPLFRALEFRETVRFTLLIFARNLHLDGEAAYLAILADQYRKGWEDVPGIRSNSRRGSRMSSRQMNWKSLIATVKELPMALISWEMLRRLLDRISFESMAPLTTRIMTRLRSSFN